MLEGFIELVMIFWRADSDRRDSSLIGESRLDRDSRRYVAWICGSLVALLSVLGAIVWWWMG